VLSLLAREVITIERYESLALDAERTLHELGYRNVEVRVGDGSLGAPERAPFGGISVTATARDQPPPALLEQLAPGAVLVCPVERGGREHLMRFRDGQEEAVTGVRFVPLVTGEP
jgi:protein-L-isoaspartate(D-aspartate) O-methyltransferase